MSSEPPVPPSENRESENDVDGNRQDYFAPPTEPCECYCLHCNRVFMSDGMWFQKVINSADGVEGFWMCATPNCDGAGFTFDIFPTDPSHPANAGWSTDDDGEEFENDDEAAPEYDPAEPHYAEMDETLDDDDADDLEGEEWKHGLAPGERPPEPPWVIEARQKWEEEQQKYDSPDERPRVLDWSDRPSQRTSDENGGESGNGDTPF